MSEQIAGTDSVTLWQVADSRRAYGFVYMCMHANVRVCAHV